MRREWMFPKNVLLDNTIIVSFIGDFGLGGHRNDFFDSLWRQFHKFGIIAIINSFPKRV